MQPLDLETEIVITVTIQPVGDQQHDSALAKDTARPVAVEAGDGAGDAGPARPVLDKRGYIPQRGIRVAPLHLPRDVRQAGAEQKAVYGAASLCQRVGETKQHA